MDDLPRWTVPDSVAGLEFIKLKGLATSSVRLDLYLNGIAPNVVYGGSERPAT